MYLDLQLAMLVSTDCSVKMASSWADSGLYHVVRRSISLAWTREDGKNKSRRASLTLKGSVCKSVPKAISEHEDKMGTYE